MIDADPTSTRATGSVAEASASASPTSTPFSRALGIAVLAGMAILVLLAFVVTEPDDIQLDYVRLIHAHVPIALITYGGFVICAAGSVMVLWKKSLWWDTAAAAGAEVGTIFAGLTVVTGAIWGRPVWNTWWEWGDVRLMTTLMMFLVYIGYLAYRRVVPAAEVRARRSAIIGLIGVLNIPLVNRSVEWWESRTLHQKSSIVEWKFEDLTLFTLAFGFLVFGLLFIWLLIQRFRIGWLEHQVETVGLQAAIAERRAQVDDHIDQAVAHPGLGQ